LRTVDTGPEREPAVVACVAGTRILAMRAVIEGQFGTAPVAKALTRVAPDVRAEYEQISSIAWVRASTDYLVHDAIAAALDREPLAFHEEMLRAAMARSFKTIWRVLLRLTSDEALIARTPSIYRRTRNVGQMVVKANARGSAELALSQFPAIGSRDIRSIGVGLEVVLSLTGRTAARAAARPATDGAIYTVTWRA
jgi:hypothetical protein